MLLVTNEDSNMLTIYQPSYCARGTGRPGYPDGLE